MVALYLTPVLVVPAPVPANKGEVSFVSGTAGAAAAASGEGD